MEGKPFPHTPCSTSSLFHVGSGCPHSGVVRHVVVRREQLDLSSTRIKKKIVKVAIMMDGFHDLYVKIIWYLWDNSFDTKRCANDIWMEVG